MHFRIADSFRYIMIANIVGLTSTAQWRNSASKCTEFSEIKQSNGYYAVQGHSGLSISILLESPLYICDFLCIGLSNSVLPRVATRPGFRGMSRIWAMLSRVPARPAPGRQMSRISRCSQSPK